LPGDIHDFVLTRFGHDIPNPMISSYKAQEKARQAKKAAAEPRAKPGRKPKPLVEGYVAPPPKQPANSNGLDLIESLEALKPLVALLGSDKVKRLVDLLG
jgi:hypothetical protein